ncbi:PREDICTED: probable membrane-associated kinase regulator 5 isoform X2 [Lupinus angustifolius]|uniref:probable membrane-associated kinase regulator 5 isoform X2 n=1 Tax=Lupinus angustifolius TaxID=3871 RepID=UPI00092EE2DA|nr:PREDICTED: probable membrane-associated kinase regulator 5 isoform X2 [Lupinus angustifolius]
MDALNFLKFWRNSTMTTTTTTTVPDIVVETDTEEEEEEEEEDSFFDLELTLHHKTTLPTKSPTHKSEKTTPFSLNEPISKRKVLPIEPISKPHSPIALLKSPPSFRLFTFKNRITPHKTQQQQLQTIKLKPNIQCSPTLSRVNSTGSLKTKAEPKAERISKDVVHKYLKLIKPLYVKVSKMKFPGEAASMGKSRSASTVVGIDSPANRSDDTLLQQNDGIQSAILHCKRSFNSRDSIDSTVHSVRSSFHDENEANI